jgi:transcriptional repressor NrdR
LVNLISRWVQSSPDKEMAANKIGQAVVKELKSLDDVAYVRFASVYKTFRDVNEFMQSLEAETKAKNEAEA